ncbi:MAG: 2-dehydropantoate 2-reductase [Chloroflexi bacterium]|nr:2-dehydropantoate 2-reductase [Chloroflexota bacterium]
MRVAVIGSGGVGGYVGGRLAQAGHEVVFLARGAHLDALKAGGLRVQSTDGDFALPSVNATDQFGELGPADLFLFTVKTYDTESAAAALKPLLRPGATVLTVQNGIDNHERIDAVLGAGVALPGTIRIETSIAEPGVIAHTSKGAIARFGELNSGGSGSERVETLRAAFAEAKLNVAVPEDMRAELWDKFLFIVPFAGLTTLTRAPIGEILASEELTATLGQLLAEAAAVAKAEGVDFGDDVVQKRLGWMRRLHPEFKSSMQRDLERGKPLEIDALAGALARLGVKHGIPTPVTSCVNAVLALEDRRARAAAGL